MPGHFDDLLYYTHRVRDPVHNFIHFSEAEKKIINLKVFQRLRNVKQLAFTCYVYPGALHSRFEHSLGVMELATQAVTYLLKKYESEIISNLKKIDLPVQHAVNCLRLAALLHDVGHLPFSHGAEAMLPKGKKHEDVSIAVIDDLRDDIDSLYFKGATGLVVQLIQKAPVIPELNFLKDILSGQIDVDRMDYLLRDSLHCGVRYGTFDHHRLLETLLVIPGGETEGLRLGLDSGGIQSLEALILARYYMYTQVLYHRTRRIYDIYLQKFFEERGYKFENLLDAINMDDLDLTMMMRSAAKDKCFAGHAWAYYIINREHHSVVYETSAFAGVRNRMTAERIYETLLKEFQDHSFIIDKNARGTIHKFVIPEEDEMGDFFYVRTKQGNWKLITEVSKIVRDMPKVFHVIRIYAKNEDGQIDGRIKERVAELEGRVF